MPNSEARWMNSPLHWAVALRAARRSILVIRPYRNWTPAHTGGKLVYGAEIIGLQFRVVIEDLLFRHARGEPTQHIPHGDAQPADTRLAGAFAWLDRDASSISDASELSWRVSKRGSHGRLYRSDRSRHHQHAVFWFSTGPGASSPAPRKSTEQIYPQPGWVEHDPEEIWLRTREIIAEAMEQRGLRPADLAAMGITNQRETTVLWNRSTGEPVANALVWQDTRVADSVAEFARDGGPDRFRAQDRAAARHLFQRR